MTIFELAALSIVLGGASIIYFLVSLVRSWQARAAIRERSRQRSIARAERLRMRQRRRVKEIRSERDAHSALVKEARNHG